MADRNAPRSRRERELAQSAPAQAAPVRRRRQSRSQQFIARWRRYGVAAFVVIMLLGGVFGILFPFRPAAAPISL